MNIKQIEILHWIAVAGLVAIMLVCNGCKSSGGSILDVVSRRYPQGMEQLCEKAYQEAYSIIKRVGVHKVRPSYVQTILVPSERRFGAYYSWRWQDMWVSGLCAGNGRTVWIAADGTMINYEVLVHEYVHSLLMTSGYDGIHYPEYDGVVFNWVFSRDTFGKSRGGIHYDEVPR